MTEESGTAGLSRKVGSITHRAARDPVEGHRRVRGMVGRRLCRVYIVGRVDESRGAATPGWRQRLLRGGLAAFTGLAVLATSSCWASEDAGPAATPHATLTATPTRSPALPEPTGRHPVGTTSLHLKDTSRKDPWVRAATVRELMVSLWYPATSPAGQRAPYMTPTESDLVLKHAKITTVPPDALSTTRTNAFHDATPAGETRSLPLVVLSPGFTNPRSTLTALAEDLASNGYVVAAVEHTYESVATTFPDGRVTTCVACQEPNKDETFWKKLVRGRATDIAFVLDQLTGPQPMWNGSRLIDPSGIAMAGHSIGGASSIDAMLGDPRVRAGINFDGETEDTIPDSGLPRPFLFLGREYGHRPGDQERSWERTWEGLTGWKRWLVVAGTQHGSFTDLVLLGDQLGIMRSSQMPGARSMEITRAYTRAFFDQHLRNQPQPLLERPSASYPEVRFCSAQTKTCT
ncbi:alpha/beta hydrolase family protein [Phytohabitans suffuscus]|uniref:alpha/beta hydrolase family protein n=1 Tax=Phytohabitans suffuscus TaxID=624315 RepID=UPI001E4E17A5|nr:hypothetical protein [Phytohabitans suffuscus]